MTDLHAYRCAPQLAAALREIKARRDAHLAEVVQPFDRAHPQAPSSWARGGLSIDSFCRGFRDLNPSAPPPPGLSRAQSRDYLVPGRGAAGDTWRDHLARLDRMPEWAAVLGDHAVPEFVLRADLDRAFLITVHALGYEVYLSCAVPLVDEPHPHLEPVRLSAFYAAVEAHEDGVRAVPADEQEELRRTVAAALPATDAEAAAEMVTATNRLLGNLAGIRARHAAMVEELAADLCDRAHRPARTEYHPVSWELAQRQAVADGTLTEADWWRRHAGEVIDWVTDRLDVDPDGSCLVCGCTDEDCSGCVERTGEPCSWVEDRLCSACAPLLRHTRAVAAAAGGLRVAGQCPACEQPLVLDADGIVLCSMGDACPDVGAATRLLERRGVVTVVLPEPTSLVGVDVEDLVDVPQWDTVLGVVTGSRACGAYREASSGVEGTVEQVTEHAAALLAAVEWSRQQDVGRGAVPGGGGRRG